jgi:hypothetical protein
MVVYMISFFLLPKGILQKLDYCQSRFLGKGTARKRNIDWLSGVWFTELKIKVGWGFMTSKSKLRLPG